MAPDLRVLGLDDRSEWSRQLARFGGLADVYFGAAYLRAHDRNGDGQAALAVVVEGDACLLVPHLACALPAEAGEGFDVQGPYGYGGPLAIGSADFVARAWAVLEADWVGRGAVAAFFRLHPLLDQRGWLSDGWQVVDDRPSVSIDLRGGVVAAFAAPVSANHRNMVARGAKLGFASRVAPPTPADLALFRSLYTATMVRLGADASYLFSADYFEALATGLGADLELVSVERPGGELSAAALALYGPAWGHYHLSARIEGSDNCATNVAIQAIAEAAARRGLVGVHLGGGRTPHPDDSLLRFKARVGAGRHVFRTARRVLSPGRYQAANAAWARQHGEPPRWFLGYRQPGMVERR